MEGNLSVRGSRSMEGNLSVRGSRSMEGNFRGGITR